MAWHTKWSWRSKMIPIFCVITTCIIQGHNQSNVLKKGCGTGGFKRKEHVISFYGMTTRIHLFQCNTSLCNTIMDGRNYRIIIPEEANQLDNNIQCHSCIGMTADQCSTTNAPIRNCYNKYESCFDGNVAITIDYDTAIIPIKSCALRIRCPLKTFAAGGVSVKIKGACCEGNLCNMDLSNITQNEELTPLVLLDDLHHDGKPPVTTPHWITSIHNHSNGTTDITRELTTNSLSYNTIMLTNSTAQVTKENQPNNGSKLSTPYWIVFFFILFTCCS
ncbi:ly6/PLAUR domain-containing protein 3-like isoform 2-T2 [Rhinophrynus dorsalis]